MTKGGKLYLATDPDREGEAISWHVLEILARKKALQGVDVKRVAFNEITKQAVLDAVAHPRDLDQPLIDAYLARRALDYLVGFTLSPVLWRKLPGSRSAGRVQSVALRLICEREAEIEAFRAREYWTVEALFGTAKRQAFTARLTHLDGKQARQVRPRHRGSAPSRPSARSSAAPSPSPSIERRQVRRNPPPPFTTSTLQQEASRKLGLRRRARHAHRPAPLRGRRYRRRDGRPDHLHAHRRRAARARGDRPDPPPDRDQVRRELPAASSRASTRRKAKNAQEAHEAIRPTDLFRTPQEVARYLDNDQRGLYELIWKRTVASQMESAVLDQVTVDIASADKTVQLRATGSVVTFDGFLTLYQEGRDDDDDEEDESAAILPDVAEGEALDRREVTPEQHFTEPPPRYSEASLVKKLEELGIGRPSTYARSLRSCRTATMCGSTASASSPRTAAASSPLSCRPTSRATSNTTSPPSSRKSSTTSPDGKIDWEQVLREFWQRLLRRRRRDQGPARQGGARRARRGARPAFLPGQRRRRQDPRDCPACANGRLGLKLGKFGAFIGCSNYPECRYTRKLGIVDPDEGCRRRAPISTGRSPRHRSGDRQGGHPAQGPLRPLRPARRGRGQGEAQARLAAQGHDAGRARRSRRRWRCWRCRASSGRIPRTGEPILAGIGRFGPYVQHGAKYKSIPADESVLDIGMNRAVALLAEAKAAGRGRAAVKPLRVVGPHPGDEAPIELYEAATACT